MVDDTHYRAFISYSHSDQKVARWLHRAIENYRVPSPLVGTQGEAGTIPRRLGKVFRDEEELAGAAQLGPQLEDPLRASDALIVICSPKAAASRWVDHEIRFFKRIHPDRPVLAVIAEGEPSGAQSCFPESLLYGVTPKGEIDRAAPMEPLAPDLQKSDNATVKLKLIAGLLGVRYDDLARRELRRARRQMALVIGLTATVIVALSGLTAWALTSRHYAIEQRDQALKSEALSKMAADACRAGAGATYVPNTPADCAATEPLPPDLAGPASKPAP